MELLIATAPVHFRQILFAPEVANFATERFVACTSTERGQKKLIDTCTDASVERGSFKGALAFMFEDLNLLECGMDGCDATFSDDILAAFTGIPWFRKERRLIS
jgi:hypothetical protein